ncbi:MAG: hypothetical protein ACI4J7_06335 [Ruminiclostridium sp.]
MNLFKRNKIIISDFISSELSNEVIAKDLYEILNNINIIECRYECNQYSVFFDKKKDSIIILDDISFENGVNADDCKVNLSMQGFKNILSK